MSLTPSAREQGFQDFLFAAVMCEQIQTAKRSKSDLHIFCCLGVCSGHEVHSQLFSHSTKHPEPSSKLHHQLPCLLTLGDFNWLAPAGEKDNEELVDGVLFQSRQ